MADQRDQALPGLDVGLIVGHVAVGEAVRERHRAVGAHGQDREQLLQIAAMLLAVSARGGGRALAAALATVGLQVLAIERDRGRVVVQL